MTRREIRSLFRLLSDGTVLRDPSGGTCCRNGCSGCAYYVDGANGGFAYDEFVDPDRREDDDDYDEEDYDADDDDYDDDLLPIGGWLAPYAVADFGDRVHPSSWGRILFPDDDDDDDDCVDVGEEDRRERNRGGEKLERGRFPSLASTTRTADRARDIR